MLLGRGPTGAAPLGYRPGLDGLRGYALLGLLLYHLRVVWPWAGDRLVTGGYASVDVFFALSGFLITSLLVDEYRRTGRIDLGSFATRRARRLVPGLVAVTGGVILASLAGLSDVAPADIVPRSLPTLLFVQNWSVGWMLPDLGQTWSLAVEAQFYGLWGLLAAVILVRVPRDRSLAVLAGTAAAIAVAVLVYRQVRFANGDNIFEVYPGTPTRLDGPLIGALAGVAHAAGWLDRLPPRTLARLAAAAATALAVVLLVSTPLDAYQRSYGGYTVNAGLGAILVLAAARLEEGRLTRAFRSPFAIHLGKLSYSLFLWHMPVFKYLETNAAAWPTGLRVVTAVALTYALSLWTYHQVERRIRPDPHTGPHTDPTPAGTH